MLPRILIPLLLIAIVFVPLALRPAQEGRVHREGTETLIVLTPHVEQITDEYDRAFAKWHERRYGAPARLDVRRPGGTSEIIRLLQDQFTAAIKGGRFAIDDEGAVQLEPGAISYDIMFGGGSYDHGRLKRGVQIHTTRRTDATTIDIDLSVPMSAPAGFAQAQLDAWFGENRVGASPVYEPDQHWIGTALSAFGIVYNRDVLDRLDLPEPRSFDDLTDPRYLGWVALADPRQSGSITTTFDSILNNRGWNEGWRVLRGLCANARYFAAASYRPPTDVSTGDAAAGLAIDFYGRSQAQAVLQPGQSPAEGRVGYSEPAGDVFIDPDPISILRGGPNPDLARRFIEFVLSDEGQALWQFAPLDTPEGADNPTIMDAGEQVQLGPAHYALRRMPVRRDFIDAYWPHLVDQVDPYEIASDVESQGWRSAIGMMMGAFGVDTHEELQAAWRALNDARAAGDANPEALAEAQRLIFSMPTGEDVRTQWEVLFQQEAMPTDAFVDFNEANYRQIRNTWRDPRVQPRLEIVYAEIFRSKYEQAQQILR